MRGGAFFNVKEGWDDFRKSLILKKEIYDGYTIIIIIMTGGVGSRFWSMSTPDYPKQFIDVMGVGRSLIQLTVDGIGQETFRKNVILL